ncbi:MAG: hypothetical protein U9Q83_11225 [Bacteroidota bacterium]|nr:hypothetical protein [Bacteroidota bacterium]
MIEYYNDILSIEASWLIDEKIITKFSYENYIKRNKITKLRIGGNGRTALVEYDSMPEWLKNEIVKELGKSPYEIEKYRYFRKYIQEDADARLYYSNFLLPDGRYLPDKARYEYYANAKLLNAVLDFHRDLKSKRKAMSRTNGGIWEGLSKIINEIRPEFRHTLPKTPGSLRNKTTKYSKHGYDELISGKYGNQNTRKANEAIEELIVSLHVLENKPYEEETWKMYTDFILGNEEIFIQHGERAGEILEPSDFVDKNGEPVMLSVSSVRNILQKYKDVTDKKRNDWLYFNNIHRPHHHRTPPQYSLSKLTLDDRDLPPLLNSDGHVKAYFVWDVASETILGVAYAVKKDEQLFVASVQDAFRNAHKLGLGMPMEVEVEHHLVIGFKEQLEILFPFVRWGNPGNAQEKTAERNNKRFKYQYEKKEFPTGRFYSKLEANRPKVTKVWTEEGMSNKQDRYDFSEIVNIYNAMIGKYNNDPHSRIKGKTRLEVLVSQQNPKAQQLPMPIISKSFGFKTETSLRRSQYVRVQYANYQLPNPDYIRKIDKNKDIEAYYLPDVDGIINNVYLFQNGNYITECKKIEKYNEARSEWDEDNKDETIYTEQASYVAQFDKMEKEAEKKVLKIGVLKKPEAIEEAEEIELESYIYEPNNEEINTEDYEEVYNDTEKKALDF